MLVYLVLENIRSAENVGAIFRTADAVSIAKIFLVGITPAPTDRFGRVQQKIHKAALGAEKTVAWEKRTDISELLTELKEKNILRIAVEQTENAHDYKCLQFTQDTALIFGSEVDGVSSTAQSQADNIIEIPMKGTKESLNVSVAVGVVLYRLLDTETST